MINIAKPLIGEDEKKAVMEVLDSGIVAMGPRTKAFEEAFAKMCETKFAAATSSGTTALHIALLAHKVGQGDEVITTAFTFIASANSALYVGARPVFVDIDPRTFNMDVSQIEAAITPRTKAILPVHIGGEPADLDAIMAIARRHGLVVIEDACQAHGAIWQGHKVGAIADMGTFSFQASKNVTGGEGGMILTNEERWAEKCWSGSNVGRPRQGEYYRELAMSSNYRLSEWAGAVLRAQLGRLEEQAQRRAQNAAYLAEALSEVEGLDPLAGDPRVTRNAYHLQKILYQPEAFGGRPARAFAQAMLAEGIPLTAGYAEPLSRAANVVQRIAFMREKLGLPDTPPPSCPVAEVACARGMWVRQNALLGSRADMDDVVRAAQKVQRAWR